jgi:hypothetical protein
MAVVQRIEGREQKFCIKNSLSVHSFSSRGLYMIPVSTNNATGWPQVPSELIDNSRVWSALCGLRCFSEGGQLLFVWAVEAPVSMLSVRQLWGSGNDSSRLVANETTRFLSRRIFLNLCQCRKCSSFISVTQELRLAATGELRRARGVVGVFECNGVLSVPARTYLMWVMVLEEETQGAVLNLI